MPFTVKPQYRPIGNVCYGRLGVRNDNISVFKSWASVVTSGAILKHKPIENICYGDLYVSPNK